MVDHSIPKLLVEVKGEHFMLFESKQETTDADGFHFPFFQVCL